MLCVATCLLSVGRATASAEGQERPRKVILFIGDGMSLAHWQTGMVMNRAPLNVNRMERIGVVQTCSLTDFNGDGPSHGTAIACGVKSRKGAVGIDATGKPAKSILAYASEQGMATGIVSANTLQEGSLSPFVAHVGSRMRVDSISAAYLEQGVDLFIGAGYGSFKDNEVNPDLLEDLRKAGYQVVLSMEAIRQAGEGKLAGFTTDGKVADIRSGRGDQFPASVRVALERLGKDPEGFLLVVGDMFVDRASHAGDVELVGQEVIDLDKAIGEALDFAEKDRSAEGFSRLLETAASLSITLAEQKCIHLAAWYEEKNERIGMKRVKDEESACELIWQIMEIEPYRDPVRKQACFDDTFRGHEFSSTVTIDGQGVLRKDGEIPELLSL